MYAICNWTCFRSMGLVKVGKFLRHYAVVIFFPTFTATTIYADWSNTQKWKKLQSIEPQSWAELYDGLVPSRATSLPRAAVRGVRPGLVHGPQGDRADDLVQRQERALRATTQARRSALLAVGHPTSVSYIISVV